MAEGRPGDGETTDELRSPSARQFGTGARDDHAWAGGAGGPRDRREFPSRRFTPRARPRAVAGRFGRRAADLSPAVGGRAPGTAVLRAQAGRAVCAVPRPEPSFPPRG